MSNRAEKMVAVIKLAKKQVGVHEEGGNNNGPIVRMYQSVIGKAEKEPWCISFLQWLVREIDKELGGAHTILFATESSQQLWHKTPHEYRLTKPIPGCVGIYAKYNSQGNPTGLGHGFLVAEVLNDDWMLTIEGNTGAGGAVGHVEREGDGVYMKKRSTHIGGTGSMRLLGFIAPWAA